jgi:hypothetical protein
MKIYKVTLYDCVEGNQGYTFHGSKRAATQRAAEFRRDNADDRSTEIDIITVKTDRAGILDALNRYAGHPDNG